MSSVSFRRETQTIKKALPPGQKKAGFSCGALLGVFPNIVGKVSRVRAQSCPKGYAKKRASIMVWVLPGVRCHCTRGKCVKLWAKKETPLPLDAGELLWRPAGGRFSNSGGFCCKGGDALHSAAFTCLLSCFPPAFPPRCLAQNTRKTIPSRDRPLFPALPPADTAQRAFPGEAARLWLPPGARLRR